MTAKIFLCAFYCMFFHQVCFAQPINDKTSKAADYQREILSIEANTCKESIAAATESVVILAVNRIKIVTAVYIIVSDVVKYSYKEIALPFAEFATYYIQLIYETAMGCSGLSNKMKCSEGISKVLEGVKTIVQISFDAVNGGLFIVKLVVKHIYTLIVTPIVQDAYTCLVTVLNVVPTCLGIKKLGYGEPLLLSTLG